MQSAYPRPAPHGPELWLVLATLPSMSATGLTNVAVFYVLGNYGRQKAQASFHLL